MVLKNQTILCLILFLAIFQDASPQGYNYTYFTAADGLPSSEVLSIAKDKKDLLWAGTTHGLSRYDGNKFINFAYSDDKYLIGAVNILKPDDQHNIWIGSSTGLYCLSNNRIVKISAESQLPQNVYDILPGFDGQLWLASSAGPLKIPIKNIDLSGQKKTELAQFILPQWANRSTNYSDTEILLIKNAADSTIFFSGKNNIYRSTSTGVEHFFQLNRPGDKILSLFPVNKSKLFYDGSLSELNKIADGEHTSVRIEKTVENKSDSISDLKWYVGTSGIFSFDPVSEKLSASVRTLNDGVLWPSGLIREDGGFWLASHQGLIKIRIAFFETYNRAAFPDIQELYSFLELKNGTLLAGANRGKVFKKQGNSFTSFFPVGKTAVPLAEIRCMYEDDKDRLWMGSGYQGIALLQNGKLTHFTKSEGLHDNSINSFFKTRSGSFFAIGDHGISKIITDTKGNIAFKAYRRQAMLSQHARFYHAVESPDGTIWTAGEEGLFYLDGDSLKEFRLLNKKIQDADIKKDSDNNIWIAAEGEGILLCRFNALNKLQIVKRFSRPDGLNSVFYMRLLVDKNDNVWAGSPNGLSCIVTKGKLKNRVFNFTSEDGFIKPGYNTLNLFEDNDGRIWVATTNGTTSFLPQKLLTETKPPQVQITGFKLLKDIDKKLNADSLLNLPDNAIPKFTYNNNAVQIEFAATDFASQENLIFFYKLEGLDTAWQNTNSEHSVTYQNLAPGEYSFFVKALNNKGQWSDNEANFSFTIKSPFWLRWWFFILCFFLLATIIYTYVKRQEANIKQGEAQKTEIEKLKQVSYQYQLEIEQVINFFATSIHEQDSIDDMLWDVAKNCISKLGFEDCVIYLKDESRNVLIQKAAWGPKTSTENNIVNPIELPLGKGIVGSVAVSGRAELIADTSKDNRYVADDEIRLSELAVPMIIDGKVVGIIDSEHHQKDFYTQRHLKILNTVASLCSEKIDKMTAEQATRDKQLEVLQLSNELATSQLTALRAQMNPHFIFNALNSIQQFVLQGNVDEANRYLSSFSKLQREILNNSDQQFISLEKEVEILKLYLELEKLRLADGFRYEITTGIDSETDEIMIPPMIVQPFVENAIWHGLLPKKGDKLLTIEFAIQNENLLLCTITDNGIGREAAAKQKAENPFNPSHKSRGLSLVYDRLEILEKQFNQPFRISIEDLKNGQNQAAGTKISMILFTNS